MENTTSIDLVNIHFLEPTTAFTDLMLSLLCILFFYRLNNPDQNDKLNEQWRKFYMYFAISSFTGFVAHGLRFYMSDNVFNMVWMTMNILTLFTTFYAFMACFALKGFNDYKLHKAKNIVLYGLLGFAALIVVNNNFLIAKIAVGLGVIYCLYTHYKTYKKGIKGSGLIFFGFILAVSTIVVHTTRLSYSEWFNFKDISHVIMMMSLTIVFYGVLMKTRQSQTKA
jgi:hypothetical protein